MEVQALNPAKLPPSPPPPETNNNPFGNSDMVGQKGRRKRRRRNICLVSTAATIILVVLVMLILALTVFKAKKPVTNMDNITLSDLSVSLDMANRLALRVNLTLDVDMTVNNPNKVGVSLSDGNSASLIYRGEQVGEIPMPAGKISADSTTGMNMTLTLMADRLISRSQLYADVVADVLPLNVYAKIKAKVSIFKVIKIRVTAVTTCDITVFVSNRTVGQQNCNSKTKF